MRWLPLNAIRKFHIACRKGAKAHKREKEKRAEKRTKERIQKGRDKKNEKPDQNEKAAMNHQPNTLQASVTRDSCVECNSISKAEHVRQ
jgi:hypothetical protein